VPPSKQAERGPNGQKIIVPAGTRLAVTLENGVSTNSAKAGDSLYFHTSFPVTQNNHVVIPVGSYIRGSLLESKRPGKIKGKGELRLRLESLIFPNGYTVDLLAAPRSADTGGKETTDSEGKITGPGGKGKDVGTVATTTVTGAGIGAIADGGKGAGIGAGVGGLVGLAAVLLTRGPDAQIPRGSTLDIVLERDLPLDAGYLGFDGTGRPVHITRSTGRNDNEQ
jgi:type IV secretion system protein VirB10